MIYSILFCLVLFAGYTYFNALSEEQDKVEVISRNIPESLSAPAAPLPDGPAPADTLKEPVKPASVEIPAVIDNEQQAAVKANNELIAKAREKLKEEDYENALRLFKELSVKDRSAFAGAGLCYFKLGDYSNAIDYLEKAAEFNSRDFIVRKLLAFAYYQKDDLGKSLNNAEAGLSISKEPELQALYDKLGRDTSAQQGYIEESTLHFKVLFDGYEHGNVNREVIGLLEDAYGFVGKELNYFPDRPVTVILYTKRDFHDTTQSPSWAGGVYDGKIRIPIKGVRGQNAILKKVLFHEYTHSVVHSLAKKCPLWINEGLAEYFSNSYPKKAGQVIPLRYLENSFAGLSSRNVVIAYWESYSAVSYLADKYGIYRIKDLLLSFSKGADINGAFKEAFSITYDEFVSEWGKA